MGSCCGKDDADFTANDADSSGTLSMAEMRKFVTTHRHGQLYQTIQFNLSIEEEAAKDIATYCAFTLAGGSEGGEITHAQFKVTRPPAPGRVPLSSRASSARAPARAAGLFLTACHLPCRHSRPSGWRTRRGIRSSWWTHSCAPPLL